ncbi:GntR family transcriptional regulator [Actinacidiphila acidipaludis]|uniref:GntR family transcriptional regulator n=1 Tax=Actinacidiphila acidipaludis TaxID=2873382 RepID=A0ABS7Q085_9ACTN|nr:GntR family transcriptional regulator [Streptomyces acidipaludis]MBY8876154.1 GntR family transcriptional regulator [Streptomyces acidipaludis]
MTSSVDPVPSLPRGLLADDALPLYAQVAGRLWADLSSHGARVGDRLPSERTLATRYGVSRVTLRAALTELSDRGMVESAAARGWFVTRHAAATKPGDAGTPEPPGARSHAVEGFADYAAKHGLTTRSRVLHSAVRPATVSEAEKLRIGPGAALFEMRRLRYIDEQVVVVEHNRLPLALCPALADTDFTTASLFATLRKADPPQLPRVAEYSVEARLPDATERELLEINDATPVLLALQLAYNQDGRPLELTLAIYRGDRYRFQGSITS